jgi:hypothetical protein
MRRANVSDDEHYARERKGDVAPEQAEEVEPDT